MAWDTSSMRRPSADVEGRRERSVTIFNICSLMTSSLTLLNRTSESTTHLWSWWESFCLKQKSLIIMWFSWAGGGLGQGDVINGHENLTSWDLQNTHSCNPASSSMSQRHLPHSQCLPQAPLLCACFVPLDKQVTPHLWVSSLIHTK